MCRRQIVGTENISMKTDRAHVKQRLGTYTNILRSQVLRGKLKQDSRQDR